MSDSIRLRGKLGEEVDKRRKKQLEPIVEMLKMPTTKESVEAFKKMGEKKKLGGKVKVKKLLPGGLLNPFTRAAVKLLRDLKVSPIGTKAKAYQESLSPKVTKAKELGIIPKDQLSKDVQREIARATIKEGRAEAIEEIGKNVGKQNLSPQKRKMLDETLEKVREYKSKVLGKRDAIMEKDIQKPAMNKAGGFIDMTKDKNYYKGTL